MATCGCTKPPTPHTTDWHKAIQATSPNFLCQCANPSPAHTTSEHQAVASVQPVFPPPPPVMHANQSVLFLNTTYAETVFPKASDSPWARFWNTFTGRCSNSHPDQQAAVRDEIAKLETHGAFKVLLTLGAKNVPGGIPLSEYVEMCNFIATIPQIGAVEIVNEPETQNGNYLTPDQVGAIAATCAPILRKANKLVVGPVTQGHNPAFFQAFMQKYGSLVDVASHHIYSLRTGAYVYGDNFNFASQLVAIAHAVSKPLWITEWNVNGGVRDANNNLVFPAGSVHGTVAQQFMRDTLKAFKDAGVAESMFWHWANNDQPVILLNPYRTAVNPDGQYWLDLAAKLAQGIAL